MAPSPDASEHVGTHGLFTGQKWSQLGKASITSNVARFKKRTFIPGDGYLPGSHLSVWRENAPKKSPRISVERQLTISLPFFFFKCSNPLKCTYVCAAETGSDGIFVGLIGDEPGALGAAAVVRPSARAPTAKKKKTNVSQQPGQRDDTEASLKSSVSACRSITPESHDVKAAGVQARQHHGQVVGLGAAVGQVHHLGGAAARVITASGGGGKSKGDCGPTFRGSGR